MKALIYGGPSKIILADKPKPVLQAPGDVVVCVMLITIYGIDLHIAKDGIPTYEPGRTLSHEGVDVVESVGTVVTSLQRGDHVPTPCISLCGERVNYWHGVYLHCEAGGWILGHRIGSIQAKHIRIPHVETSLHKLPPGVNEEALVMLLDIFPTGFEYGVLNGRIQPGNSMAIVGTGPTGPVLLLTVQFYSPAQIIMIDANAARLEVTDRLGTTACIGVSCEDTAAITKWFTDDVGVDCATGTVGASVTFEPCQQLAALGGVITNIGVHGVKADLHLEALWSQNIAIATRLVDTVGTLMLLKTVRTGRLLSGQLIMCRSKLDDALTVYDMFRNVVGTQVLKMIISAQVATHVRWIFCFVKWMP